MSDYTNLFSPNNFEKNDRIILKHFLLISSSQKYFYEYVLNMAKENISQEFRLKNIEEIKNYFNNKID